MWAHVELQPQSGRSLSHCHKGLTVTRVSLSQGCGGTALKAKPMNDYDRMVAEERCLAPLLRVGTSEAGITPHLLHDMLSHSLGNITRPLVRVNVFLCMMYVDVQA